MIKCGNCGKELNEGLKFCDSCGFSLENLDDTVVCSACGGVNNESNKHCVKCGSRLKDIVCPYCKSSLEDGVLKCKYCGEWVNKPIGSSSFGGVLSSKLFVIVAYLLTLLNVLITCVMLSTPYIVLSSILLVNIVWTFVCFVFSIYGLRKFGSEKFDFPVFKSVKVHMVIILVVNIILLLPQIFALFYNPFG